MSDRAPNMWELDTMLAERPKGKIRRVSRSSVLGINFDMDLPRSSQTLKPQSNEAGDTFFLENRAFDSDDSIKDPDFNSLCSSTTIDSRTNDEIISHGSHIEESLETQKPKSINKKVRYQLRNSGQSYQTLSGNTVRARAYTPFDICRTKCNEKVGIGQVKSLFKHYWSLGSYDQRILYIGSLIAIEDKKCDTLCSGKRKRNSENTMKYTLEIEGNTIQVCKKHFAQCFDETDSFIKTVIRRKISCLSMPFKNLRGKHTPSNKIDVKVEDEVKKQISSFPAYESHYSRRDTTQKYLPSSLNLSVMYRLYKLKVEKPVSQSKYCEIFKTMGLKFKAPNVDTCSTCDTYVAFILRQFVNKYGTAKYPS